VLLSLTDPLDLPGIRLVTKLFLLQSHRSPQLSLLSSEVRDKDYHGSQAMKVVPCIPVIQATKETGGGASQILLQADQRLNNHHKSSAQRGSKSPKHHIKDTKAIHVAV
jgi:hypothetical protein